MITGELTDREAVRRAVRGADAVVSALGPSLDRKAAGTPLVTDSRLDWTIARFTRPTDGARTGTVRAGYLGRDHIRASITRADIATFLLDQSTDPRFHRAAPAISN